MVVPIHNGIDQTRRLLDSLRSSSYANLEAIVVDDGSTDGSAEILAQEYPEVVIVPGSGSMWWTRATNTAIKLALTRGAELILTINQDAVMDVDAARIMVDTAGEFPRSLIGAQVRFLEDPERVWFAGADLDPVTADIEHRTQSPDERGPVTTAMLTGLGMLIPKRVFDDLGGLFDEAFPQYFADCDLSLRAKSIGYDLLVQPRAVIYNEVGSSWLIRTLRARRWTALGAMLFSSRSPYWIGGRVRFYKRHWGRGYRIALLRLYGRLAVRFFRATRSASLPQGEELR